MGTSTTLRYDEILSDANFYNMSPQTILFYNESENEIEWDSALTTFLLFIFPLYVCAILLNFLTIYLILTAKIYRQYLSNLFLVIICIGTLINIHGQIFLILLRWANDLSSTQLCSSSFYLRDSGFILIHTHILLLVLERIFTNLKKHPTNQNNQYIQNAHYLLIILSLINILFSITVPIYIFNHSSFSSLDGLCLSEDISSYRIYLNWLFYCFGHLFVWSSSILLILFFVHKKTISYLTLIPMNIIILIISLSSCINLLTGTLLDDMIGIGRNEPTKQIDVTSKQTYILMNSRDFISIVHKLIIGILFFVCRPEIRRWLYKSFQMKQKNVIIPQMLHIRTEHHDETDDGNLHFRSNI